MSHARRTPITLSAALMLGVALGLAGPWEKQVSGNEVPVPARESNAANDAGATTASAAAESSSARTAASSSSNAYAAAWELLRDGKLTRKERRNLESDLLEEWAKVDLRAALHAAFEEDWTISEDPFDLLPLEALQEEIRRQSDLVWALISSREYGLHTRELRTAWIRVCAAERPLEVLSRLQEIPPDVRASAVWRVVVATRRAADHPFDQPAAGTDEVVAAILAMRGSPYEAAAMAGLAVGIASVTEASKLSALLLNPPDPALRDLYLRAYAMEVEYESIEGRQVARDLLPPEICAEVEALLGSPFIRIDGVVFPLTEHQPPLPGK